MSAPETTSVIISAISCIVMVIISAEYLHIQHKRTALLEALGSERAQRDKIAGLVLLWFYIVLTLAMIAFSLFFSLLVS